MEWCFFLFLLQVSLFLQFERILLALRRLRRAEQPLNGRGRPETSSYAHPPRYHIDGGSWAVYPNTVLYGHSPMLFLHPSVAVVVISCCDDLDQICHIEELICHFEIALS